MSDSQKPSSPTHSAVKHFMAIFLGCFIILKLLVLLHFPYDSFDTRYSPLHSKPHLHSAKNK